MSLTDKINVIIRNAARDCAFKCAKKMPEELRAFVYAAQQSESGNHFLSTWPDTWPDADDELINEVMWSGFELFCEQHMPDVNLEEDENVTQKHFMKYYNTVFKQANAIADYFDEGFNPIHKMMTAIGRALNLKSTELHDAPYDESYFDDMNSTYHAYAIQVFKYLS